MDSNDLGLLVALDALLQEGSVTKAAARIGLSTPAMSHALARIRERLGDPILVRSGRAMVLTPRAESLRPRVRSVIAEGQGVFAEEGPFVPERLERTFVVRATDYVLTVLGLTVDRILSSKAPRAALHFVPNAADDASVLRDGGCDLAVGIYAELPPEMRTRQLLTDRFVCLVRKDHPSVGRRLSLEQFVRLPHIQVAPRGKPGGYVDDVLAERGLSRRVARAVPYFVTAVRMVAQTDYVLTVSERIALALAPSLGLVVHEAPLPLEPYALNLVWHPRLDEDMAHRFVREAFVAAAQEVAGDKHARPRTRLSRGRRP